MLEEKYDRKHEEATTIAKLLAEQRLNTCLWQIGQTYAIEGSTVLVNLEKNRNFSVNVESSLLRSIRTYLQEGNLEMMSNLQNRLGIHYVESKSYNEALSFFQRALSNKEELKNYSAQLVICNNIAALHSFMGDLEQANFYYNMMHKLAVKNKDLDAQASSLEQLATIKAAKNAYLEAQTDIIKRVLPLYKRAKNVSGRVRAYNSLAAIYLAEKKYTESRWFYLQAVKMASINDNNNIDMSYSLYYLAKVKKMLEEYDLAIDDYNKAVAYALASGDDILRMQIYDDLGDIYIHQKDYAKALSSLAEYDSIKNKLILASQPKELAVISNEMKGTLN
ncbi:tetratricopeptide repeat protein [Olivibacter sp. SDN3]|uniref:tetratricopeptide repeat protein n=1 Tax=Olivibacter sp. SDN3 TaxID=2764720 RepID=UPI001651AAF4|nr:tetratricopeptide repeat protein [Olivibacter sp. SDN3]QNL51172.1 tetratricopeptide repeat protein [Olivibacter sp. SDN3]